MEEQSGGKHLDRALVTGGTGFVGSAVVRELLARGVEVRVLVRETSDRRNIVNLPVEILPGDLEDTAELERALKGCNALFHVAADYRLWVPNPSAMYRTNVEGTRNIMLAALSAGVERIVYTSSVATLGLGEKGKIADEETPVGLEDMIGHYKRSKFMAESEVRRLVREEGLPAVIVNPSTPVGPRDIRPTPTGRMIVDALAGRMPAYVDTGLNIVHVDDVAAGHLQACEKGRFGENYVLGGENLTLREILHAVAAIAGRKPPRFRLSCNVVQPLAYISEGWARLSGREPQLTVDGIRLARKLMFFSSGKAQSELGYGSRPVIEAFEEAADWFRRNGYC